MAQKQIRFDYVKPCLVDDPCTPVSLINYLQCLIPIPIDQRLIPYGSGHRIRIGTVRYHESYQPENGTPLPFPLWELVYTRIRPDVPGITTATRSDLTPLELDDNEYLADDTVALYDPQLNYFVVQRNRLGTPLSAMQTFFNRMNLDDHPNMEFQIIKREDRLERALGHTFHHSFHVRFTNTRRTDLVPAVNTNSTLANIISIGQSLASDQEYPVQAELTIKIPGKRPGNTLLHQAINTMTRMANSLIETDAVDKLVVRGKADEESPFEDVDLVQDMIREFIAFEMHNVRFIPAPQIFDKLATAYAQRRPTLPRE